MLTIVGWLWRDARGRSIYTPEHANIWARMIHKHLTIPHRFILVTDQPSSEFDPLIQPFPLWDDFRTVKRTFDWGDDRPSCYVRLKAFSATAREIFGDRFVSIDLDCVVCGELDPLFDRGEDFLILRRTPVNEVERPSTYNGSMWMMTTGAREQVWTDFKGEESVAKTFEFIGTDQAWIRYKLGPNEAGWSEADGVYCYRNIKFKSLIEPPAGARIVFFNTKEKPWEFAARRRVATACQRCGFSDRSATGRCTHCSTRMVPAALLRQYDWVIEKYL